MRLKLFLFKVAFLVSIIAGLANISFAQAQNPVGMKFLDKNGKKERVEKNTNLLVVTKNQIFCASCFRELDEAIGNSFPEVNKITLSVASKNKFYLKESEKFLRNSMPHFSKHLFEPYIPYGIGDVDYKKGGVFMDSTLRFTPSIFLCRKDGAFKHLPYAQIFQDRKINKDTLNKEIETFFKGFN